ncbi:hypothetical protein AYI68_g2659, partial [Smittium mucronatum]
MYETKNYKQTFTFVNFYEGMSLKKPLTQDTGICLLHFAIYAPHLCTNEGEEHLQILYYFTSNTLPSSQKKVSRLNATSGYKSPTSNLSASASSLQKVPSRSSFLNYFTIPLASKTASSNLDTNSSFTSFSQGLNESHERVVSLETKLSQIGLSSALSNLASSFDPNFNSPLVLKTKNSISLTLQVEPGIFVLLCVTPPRNPLNSANSKPFANQTSNLESCPIQHINTETLADFVKDEYQMYTLLNGSIVSRLKFPNGPKLVKKSTSLFFSVSVLSWDKRWAGSPLLVDISTSAPQNQSKPLRKMEAHSSIPIPELGILPTIGAIPRIPIRRHSLVQIQQLSADLLHLLPGFKEILIFNRAHLLVFSSIIDSYSKIGSLAENSKYRSTVNKSIVVYIRKLFSSHFQSLSNSHISPNPSDNADPVQNNDSHFHSFNSFFNYSLNPFAKDRSNSSSVKSASIEPRAPIGLECESSGSDSSSLDNAQTISTLPQVLSNTVTFLVEPPAQTSSVLTNPISSNYEQIETADNSKKYPLNIPSSGSLSPKSNYFSGGAPPVLAKTVVHSQTVHAHGTGSSRPLRNPSLTSLATNLGAMNDPSANSPVIGLDGHRNSDGLPLNIPQYLSNNSNQMEILNWHVIGEASRNRDPEPSSLGARGKLSRGVCLNPNEKLELPDFH